MENELDVFKYVCGLAGSGGGVGVMILAGVFKI